MIYLCYLVYCPADIAAIAVCMCAGVRSITGPWYQGPCPHPSCGDPDNCPGNKVCYIDGPGSALHLVLTHLKTSRWASFVPVSFTLPPELTKLFTAFIEVARGIIMTARWPDHPYMFVNTQTFNQLRPQEISQWFRMAFPEEIQHLIPSPRACRCAIAGVKKPTNNAGCACLLLQAVHGMLFGVQRF